MGGLVRLHELESLDGDRAGLPGEPGRGFSQDVPLFPERLVLAAEPAHLLPLLGRQTVCAAALIPVGLA